MSGTSWKHFGIFFVGFVLIVSGVVIGLGAVNYEFKHLSSTEEPEDWSQEFYDYEELSENDQEIVDSALEGERQVFRTDAEVPGEGWVSIGDRLYVYHEDQYHLFARQPFFDARSPVGLAALALVIGGATLMVEAIRRQHFPHYRPLRRFR